MYNSLILIYGYHLYYKYILINYLVQLCINKQIKKMNTVQSVKLQTKVKTKSKSLGRVGIIISIFILALSGSWSLKK